MLKEFKEFAMRGNVIDLAVGVIIGAAFGKIVTSLVNDIIMPPIGVLLGGVDFTEMSESVRWRVCVPSGCKRSRCCDDQLRCLRQHCDQFPDRRFRDLHGHQTDEQAEEERGSRTGSAKSTATRRSAAGRNSRFAEDEKLNAIRYSPIARPPDWGIGWAAMGPKQI